MWLIMAGPYLAAAVLLVVAGAPKVVDPMPLVSALRTTGLPVGRGAVRAFALAEVVVGAAACAVPGRAPAALVAVAYALFTAFVALALSRGGVLASCGCFGRADTPPTRSHLAVTAGLAATAAAVAVAPPAAPVWTAVTLTRPATAALLGFVALLTVLGHAVMAVLPLTTPEAARSAATTRGRG